MLTGEDLNQPRLLKIWKGGKVKTRTKSQVRGTRIIDIGSCNDQSEEIRKEGR